MDFREVDRRYTGLKRQHKAGTISDEEFDEQLKQLMVQDDQDRWWAKSRKTGEWHYRDGEAWVRGTPLATWIMRSAFRRAKPTGATCGPLAAKAAPALTQPSHP